MKSRREFIGAAATLGLGAIAAAQSESQPAAEPALKSQFLFSMEAELEPPQALGDRQIYIVKSGIIKGPRINGVILAGGGDWSKKRSDGSTMLDVRGTFKTDDDQLIYSWYNGIVATKEGKLYFRTTPYFETASEKYAWLNNIVAVGVFKLVPGKVAYDVFEIL
jgi:hypothetical protein